MKQRQPGFTLIEMLIVITLLGIFATIVLASLSGAKNRGNDTGVESDLATIQTQGVLYFGVGDTYGADNFGADATCGMNENGNTVFYDPGSPVEDAIQNAVASAQNDANGGVVICQSSSSAFLVSAELSSGAYWCIDSVGDAKQEQSAPSSGDTACAP